MSRSRLRATTLLFCYIRDVFWKVSRLVSGNSLAFDFPFWPLMSTKLLFPMICSLSNGS